MGRRELPSVVIEAARALGVPQDSLSLLPGAAGQTWSSGEHILRVRPTKALKVEMASWAAASRVVPTPQLIDFVGLHPFNVLVDEGDRVSGVVDWANVASGHPDLDRARSASILTFDPAAVARQAQPWWAALTQAWAESSHWGDVPAVAMAWACRFMLNDPSSRYDGDELARVCQALSDFDKQAPASHLAEGQGGPK